MSRHKNIPSFTFLRYAPKLHLVWGQALLEFAIFGVVTLAALGFLIRVGMTMNFDQEIRMAAFRRALAAAHAENSTDQDAMAVAYHYMSDRQMPNPTDGFMSLSRTRTESSAFVEWGDRLTFAYEIQGNDAAGRKTQPRVVVRSNNVEQEFRQNDFPDDEDGLGEAFRGVVSEATTTNDSKATLSQTVVGASLASTTTTCSDTTLNTKSSDHIGSCVSGGGRWPP